MLLIPHNYQGKKNNFFDHVVQISITRVLKENHYHCVFLRDITTQKPLNLKHTNLTAGRQKLFNTGFS